MKFLHIADLHFGKSMNGISLVENDQPYWVEKFLEIVDETKADAVVIAGDVYDRSSPSAEAVKLLDKMLTELALRNIAVLMTAGNHDSGQKLSFASHILDKNNIYISGVISEDNAEIPHVTLNDEYGEITFWLMPYIFPALINDILKTEYRDYNSVCQAIIEKQNIDFTKRNVMVAHQNITRNGVEAERGGSESMVAGVGGIEYTVFEKFEYTALGHIHAAQQVGAPNIRYAGSPLCYHFDEAKFPKKGPVCVEITEKGTVANSYIIPVEPLHNVRVIEDTYDGIINSIKNSTQKNEYLKIIIKDKKNTPELKEEFRKFAESYGSKVLEITSAVRFSRVTGSDTVAVDDNSDFSVLDMFMNFYSSRNNGSAPDEKEQEIINKVAELLEAYDTENAARKIIEFAESQGE